MADEYIEVLQSVGTQFLISVGYATEDKASYIYLNPKGMNVGNQGAYFWIAPDYVWLGSEGAKSVILGTRSRELFAINDAGGAHIGEDHEDAGVGKGELGMTTASDAPAAPGAGRAKLAFIADPSNPGKAQLVAYAGTSAVPTVIMSGIGDGF